MISKDISRRTLDQQHVDEQQFPGPFAFLFFFLPYLFRFNPYTREWEIYPLS